MLRKLLNWIHQITAPPPEMMVGDVWVGDCSSPWSPGCTVLAVAEGWVQFRNSAGGVHAQTEKDFRRGMKLKSRA